MPWWTFSLSFCLIYVQEKRLDLLEFSGSWGNNSARQWPTFFCFYLTQKDSSEQPVEQHWFLRCFATRLSSATSALVQNISLSNLMNFIWGNKLAQRKWTLLELQPTQVQVPSTRKAASRVSVVVMLMNGLTWATDNVHVYWCPALLSAYAE